MSLGYCESLSPQRLEEALSHGIVVTATMPLAPPVKLLAFTKPRLPAPLHRLFSTSCLGFSPWQGK